MIAPTQSEIRSLLREKNAVLVHFSSTPKMSNNTFLYPSDLRGVIDNVDTYQPTCSTVLPNDTSLNAAGSIGVILDLNVDGSVLSAKWEDSGSSRYGGASNSSGMNPTIEDCRRSIEERGQGYNEWIVGGYRIRGVFFFHPILVDKLFKYRELPQFSELMQNGMIDGDEETQEAVEVNLRGAMVEFDGLEFYTVRGGCFCTVVCDLAGQNISLHEVSHSDIYP